MDLSQNLNVQLSQKLTLSHEMLQSLDLIQLPILDLKEKIQQEVLENPALEIGDKENFQNIEKIEDVFNEKENYFEDSSSAELNVGIAKNPSNLDLKRQFLEGAITRQESLHDMLLWQFHLLELTEEQITMGETIISLIDENGFFNHELGPLFPTGVEQAQDILEIIQTFDPPGIASKDVREALLYQIESLKEDDIDQTAYTIVKDYFDLLLERKDAQIARELKIKIDEVKSAFAFIGRFEPYPGREYDSAGIDYIIPDAYVYKKEEELIVEINDEILPSLTISKYMEKIADDVKNKKKIDEQRKYISDKVHNAKRFLYMIQQRHNSLFKVVLAIAHFQKDFFFKGPKHLSPLNMKQVATEVGLAESTISRLASSKYIQTEWGIHEIKYFFTNSISGMTGAEGTSAESVREEIKEIILAHDGKKISDQKITDKLNEKGIKIARRTVAKYRKMLKILPSHQRNI